MEFSSLAINVFNALRQHGGKVFVVGGSVRDMVMGIEGTHDIDVEVYHLSYDALVDVLSRFGSVNTFGKSFAIVQLSTLPGYDFALPRREVKVGDKHQDFNIMIDENLSYELAALRRDLTMNALMYDVFTKEVIDSYGGIDDIRNGIIRCVCKDTFIEDPLRVLRVAQFSSRFNMEIDSDTYSLCKQMVALGMLEHLSIERVYQEYCKILMSDYPWIGFEFLRDINALPPYLNSLVTTMQRLDYHPEGDVFTHTMLVLKEAVKVRNRSDDPLSFMWSCLLHDIGKPLVSDSDGHAYNHHKSGVEVFKDVNLITSKKQRVYIKTMIYYHMHLMNMSRNHSRDIKYLRLLKEIEGKISLRDLVLLTYCDKLGRGKVVKEQLFDFDIYIRDKIERLGECAPKAVVSGQDLIDYGFNDCMMFKKLLKDAYEYQLQGMSKERILGKLRNEQG